MHLRATVGVFLQTRKWCSRLPTTRTRGSICGGSIKCSWSAQPPRKHQVGTGTSCASKNNMLPQSRAHILGVKPSLPLPHMQT